MVEEILRKKDFKFRGKTLEELKTLDVREFAELMRARQRRSTLRNFQKIEDFVSSSQKKIAKGKSVKTHHRDLVVVPAMVGMKINIHCGNKFVPIDIVGEMLGHKFGEFAPTRVKAQHVKSTAKAKAKVKK